MKNGKYIILITAILAIAINATSQNNIDVLILNKKYNDALTQIAEQERNNPSVQLYLKKGLIYNRLQNYKEALNSFSAALQLDPSNVEVLTEMADDFAVLGNNLDAEVFYKKAIELDTTNLQLYGKLGRILIKQKKTKDAYNIFTKVYGKDSTNVLWNKQLAFCSYRIQKRKQAIYLYEKVLEANQRDHGSYTNLIHLYDKRKNSKDILALIDKGLTQFPGDAELLLERANFYFRLRDYKNAMPAFENYFSAGGDNLYEIKMNYAISTYFAKEIDLAMSLFGELYSVNPNDIFVMYYLGLCNKKLNNYVEAEKMMNWAIEGTVPDYVSEMYHILGQIYGQQRKFKESIAALEKSHELDPQNHEVLFEIATTYEEYNSNKTLALNYYQIYLKEAGESAENVSYALDRISKIKEDLFFDE